MPKYLNPPGEKPEKICSLEKGFGFQNFLESLPCKLLQGNREGEQNVPQGLEQNHLEFQ